MKLSSQSLGLIRSKREERSDRVCWAVEWRFGFQGALLFGDRPPSDSDITVNDLLQQLFR